MDEKSKTADAGKCTERIKTPKCAVRQNETRRSARYNCTKMKAITINAKNGFATRLAELREKAGVSAREMSLSLGQGTGYINNIENGHNLPSMSMFFEICEYLDITPKAFFAYADDKIPCDNVLTSQIGQLDYESRIVLAQLIERLIKQGGS